MENTIDSSYKRFQELLERNNVTAYKVAKETGVTTATLTSWKQGKYVPKTEKLKLIADFFHVSTDYIMYGKEDTKKIPTHSRDHLEMIKMYETLDDEGKKKLMEMIRLFTNYSSYSDMKSDTKPNK